MGHPRVYQSDDPLLGKVREVVSGFLERAEVESWGRPTFRAGRKIFAVYGASQDYPQSVVFKPDDEERPALHQDRRFVVPPYYGPSGWLALDLTAAPVDWTELYELLDSSYRQVALVRMIRVLDTAQRARVRQFSPSSSGQTDELTGNRRTHGQRTNPPAPAPTPDLPHLTSRT